MRKNYYQESTNFPGVYIRRGRKRTSVFYISYRIEGKQQMDRLGTINEGWTAESAADERLRRILGSKPNHHPPSTDNSENVEERVRRRSGLEPNYLPPTVDDSKVTEASSTQYHSRTKEPNCPSAPTISELFEQYIQWKKLERGLKGFSYERVMRFQFSKYLSSFNERLIHEVTLEDMLKLRNQLRDQELAAKSIHNIMSMLTQLQNFAASKGYNPGDLKLSVAKPKRSEIITHTRERLTKEQLNMLMEVLRKEPPFRANLYYLAMLTGMRRSELVNLKWADVRWEEKKIIIRNPKSGKEYEVIPLIKVAAEVLKHQRQQMHLCTSSCFEADRVFFDSYGRPIAKRQTCIDNWSKVIREKAGIPKSFRLLHGLRHHFGSVHAANGTPMPVLQKLMRHSEIKTTMIYIEINQNELEEAAQKTVELLDFQFKSK